MKGRSWSCLAALILPAHTHTPPAPLRDKRSRYCLDIHPTPLKSLCLSSLWSGGLKNGSFQFSMKAAEPAHEWSITGYIRVGGNHHSLFGGEELPWHVLWSLWQQLMTAWVGDRNWLKYKLEKARLRVSQRRQQSRIYRLQPVSSFLLSSPY